MTSHELAKLLLERPDRMVIVESYRHPGSYREAMDLQEYKLESDGGSLYDPCDDGDEIGILIAP